MSNVNITNEEIREVYREDTVGRRYHPSIITKNNQPFKEEASEVTSMNLNQPMNWYEFRTLSNDMKVMYLKHLRDTYGIHMTHLAEMFGVHYSVVAHKVAGDLGLKGLFSKSRTPLNREQVAAWCKFLGKEEKVEESVVETVETVEPTPVEVPKVSSFSFTMDGNLDIAALGKTITAMIPEGTRCQISVSIFVEGDKE